MSISFDNRVAIITGSVGGMGRAAASYDSVGARTSGEAIVQAALDACGRVDIVINNAGHLRNAAFEEIDDSLLDSIVNVPLKGAFYVTQPAYRP